MENHGQETSTGGLIENRPLPLLGVFLLSTVVIAVFNRLFNRKLFLPTEFYESPSPLLSVIRETFDYSSSIAIVGLASLFVVLIYFVFRIKWSDVCGPQIRIFVLFMAALLAWRHSTIGFNHYFEAAYDLERLLVIAAFVASCWRPAFLLLLPPLVFLLQGQISLPYLSYSPTELSMPLKVLIGFLTLLLVRLFSEKRFDLAFVWVSVVVIVSHYWTAAYSKYLIDWHEFGEIHHMMSASYAGGWLNFLNTESISGILQTHAKFNALALVLTLLLETLVIFSLFSGRLLAMLLITAALFHAGVYAVSGISFWQWLLVDLSFVYLLLFKSSTAYLKSSSLPLYTRIISVLLIVASPFWMGAARLGWHDSPVNYTYHIRAFDTNNNSTVLRPAYFTPYEYTFNLNSLQFLSESKILPISGGATQDLALAKTLAATTSRQDILSTIDQQATVRFDEQRAKDFDGFIKQFVANKQNDHGYRRWFDYLPAPLFLHTNKHTRHIVDMPIQQVDIYLVTSWFDGTTFQVIEETLVRSITIGSDL